MSADFINNIDAALDFLHRGWAPIPLCWPTADGKCGCGLNHQGHDIGKAPLLGKGYQKLQPIDADVSRWWGKWPLANVGLLLEPSGLVFIGPDTSDAVSWAARQPGGLPPTTMRVSNNPGFIYLRSEGCPIATRKHKEGGNVEVDIKTNGYCVGHGRHRTGTTIHLDSEEPVSAPAWGVELLKKAHPQGPKPYTDDACPPVQLSDTGLKLWQGKFAIDLVDGELKPADEARAVDRSATLFALGCRLVKAGATRPTVLAALAQRDEALGYLKYADRNDGGAAEYARIADKVLANAEAICEARLVSNVKVPSAIRTVTAAELAVKTFPEPKEVVPGILVEGATILAGPPKIGKSWLALDIAIAIAESGLALGALEVEGGDVLYLALEDGERRLQKRLKTLLGDEPPPHRLHLATTWPAFDQGGRDALEEWIGTHPDTRLVIVDTLKRVRPRQQRGASVYSEDYDAVAPLADLARRKGICILIVHHTRKLIAEDAMDRVSGSTGLTGAADAVLVLRRARGERTATLMIMGRDIEEQELALHWRAPRWELLGDAHEHQRSAGRQAILGVLRQSGPLGPKEISEILGRNRATIRWLLRQMTESGELKSEDGKYEAPPPRTPPVRRQTPSAQADQRISA